MPKRLLHISLFALGFYFLPFIFQHFFGFDSSPLGLLLKLPAFLLLGILILIWISRQSGVEILGKLSNTSAWAIVISRSFLLLAALYLAQSLGRVSYVLLLPPPPQQTEIQESLLYIISKPGLALVLCGPFVWLNVLFIELSRAVFLDFLTQSSKISWTGIFVVLVVSFLLSSLQLENSIVQFLGLFITNLILSIAYLWIRDLRPLILASILYQSIDLVAFWVYS